MEEDQEAEEPERLLKKLKLDGEVSPLNTSLNSSIHEWPNEETDKLSKTHCTELNGNQKNGEGNWNQPSSSNSLVHENGDLSHPSSISKSQQRKNRLPSHSMTLRDRGAGAASPKTSSRNKRPVPRSSSPAVQLKEPKVEPETVLSPQNQKTENHALLKPKDELSPGDMPCSEVPPNMSRIGMPFLSWLHIVEVLIHSIFYLTGLLLILVNFG